MSVTPNREKSISLTLRGFDISAEEVVSLMGVAAERIGNIGEPVKSTVKTRLTRSYVIFSKSTNEDISLNNMFSMLMIRLGGIERICQVQNKVTPEFTEIEYDLPVRTSDLLQDGYLSKKTIANLFLLKASISFSFF